MSDGYGTRYIKPCPFCGSKAEAYPAYDEGWWQAGCVNEECRVECYVPSTKSFDEAINSWNNRHQ